MARIGLKLGKYNQIDYTTKKYKALGTESTVPTLRKIIDEKASLEFNSAELYADDTLAESDYSFKKGSLTITVDDDDDTINAELLGNTITTGEVVQKISDSASEFGYGHIVPKIVGGTKKWKVEFFPRVKFAKITADGKTRGESVEFTTCSIEATIFPLSEAINGMDAGTWEKHQTFDTEAEAVAYLDELLTPISEQQAGYYPAYYFYYEEHGGNL